MSRITKHSFTIDTWLLVGFIVTTFIFGGGSRADTSSLLILRPAAALFLTMALIRARPWPSGHAVPVAFALATTALIAVQLVPLPPSIWTGLPARGPLLDVMRTTGVTPGWRPLSMQPIRTWNALFSMLVPLAALMLSIAAGRRATQRLLPVFVILGAVSALLGLLQVIGPDTSPLYLYRGTGEGYANGLFANRNHHAAVIACLFPMIAVLAHVDGPDPRPNPRRRAAIRGMLAALALFLIPLLLLTGSRAGLLLAGIGMAGGAWLYSAGAKAGRAPMRRSSARLRRYLPVLIAGGALLLIVLSIAASRAPSIDRLFGAGMEGGRRAAVYPTVLEMVPMYLPFGAGFGTFAEIFQISEPDALLGPTYLNQAHNDWLQIIIEGGIPAGLLAIAALVAVARLARAVLARPASEGTTSLLGRAGLLILVILGLASIVDYPTRTSSVAVLAVIAVMWMLAAAKPEARDADRRKGWPYGSNPPKSPR